VTGGPMAERAAWRGLLAQAAEAAQVVLEGGPRDRFATAQLARAVIEISPGLDTRPSRHGPVRRGVAFPLKHVSAQNAAEAFLVLARGFVAAGWPAATARSLAALAADLDAMLTAAAHAEAAQSRRVAGGDD